MQRDRERFAPEALRAARQARPGPGGRRWLSAAALAERVGATKAQILAYEAGYAVPTPARIAALAHALRVPPSTLLGVAPSWASLNDLRRMAGLTAREAALASGLSLYAYRRLEREGIWPSHDQTLPHRLSRVLGQDVRTIKRAVNRALPARRRRHRARATLKKIVCEEAYPLSIEQALEQNPREPYDLDSSVRRLAGILGYPTDRVRRATQALCEDVRDTFRREHAARMEQQLVRDPRERERAHREMLLADKRRNSLMQGSVDYVQLLLDDALTERQWRALAALSSSEARIKGVPARLFADDVWASLDGRSPARSHPLVELRHDLDDAPSYVITKYGTAYEMAVRQQHTRLYDRPRAHQRSVF